MVEEIRQELDRLNQLLQGVTPFRLGLANPREMKPAPVNAHFMTKKKYDQLVANIRKDGNLATLPFCWRDDADGVHILSGHHRIEAAADAGIETVLYLYTDAQLSDEERTAIQLSHNAIFGEDDLNILRQQWESIASVEAKLYSGLDDEFFQSFEPVNLGAFNEKDLRFERVELLFLPAEIEQLTATLNKVQAKAGARYVALYDQYDEFAQALMRFKEGVNIYNTALAFAVMARTAELFCDYLAQKADLAEADLAAVEGQLQAEGLLDPN